MSNLMEAQVRRLGVMQQNGVRIFRPGSRDVSDLVRDFV